MRVIGDEAGVTGLRVRPTVGNSGQPDPDATPQDLALTGVFIAIGHTPNTAIFDGQLDMQGGYIKVRSGTVRPSARGASPLRTASTCQ